MDDDAFLAFCKANNSLRIERESSGEIVLMTPAGGRSDRRGVFIIRELDYWAEEDGTGVAFGSNAGFILTDGSTLSPDAAWVRNAPWDALPPERQEKFLPFCPEFVIEVLSSSDSLRKAKDKMLQLERQNRHHAPAKSKVLVRENPTGELHIEYRGQSLAYPQIERRPERKTPCGGDVSRASPRHVAPANNHPWKQSYKQMPTPAGAF